MEELKAVDAKVIEAESLLARILRLEIKGRRLQGSEKLANRIKSEIKFLKNLQDEKVIFRPSHLSSSNLSSLSAILDCVDCIGIHNVTALLQRFKHDQKSLSIDIVACHGYVWVKVIARNPTALYTNWSGQGHFGDKSLANAAHEYLAMAKCHPVDYRIPQTFFHFTRGVPDVMAYELNKIGVLTDGDVVNGFDENNDLSSSEEDDDKKEIVPQNVDLSVYIHEITNLQNGKMSASNQSHDLDHSAIKKVNLDVTTMLSLVSNLCNGQTQYVYGIPVLDEQAEQERKSPVLPRLQDFLKDKETIACKTAVRSFQDIITTIGGPNEKERAQKLLAKLTIVDDKPSQQTLDLATSTKINPRAKIIFGTGAQERAITVTANTGFVRAALQSGVHYSVFEHQARALTEQKEDQSKIIKTC